MEKRLFIATALSFVVLYIWLGTQPKPDEKALETVKITDTYQASATKEGSEEVISTIYPIEANKIEEVNKKTVEKIQEEKVFLENDSKLRIEFSNLGGAITGVYIKDYETELPVRGFADIVKNDTNLYQLVEQTDSTLEYVYETPKEKITKKYSLRPDEYIVQTNISVQRKENMSNQTKMSIQGMIVDTSRMDKILAKKDATSSRDKALFEYAIATDKGTFRKNKAYAFSDKNKSTAEGLVNWVGFRNRYYCAVVKPLFETESYKVNNITNNQLSIVLEPKNIELSQDTVNFEFITYIGPEKLEILKKYGYGFEDIKRYYRLGVFDMVAKFIRATMFFIYSIIPNWGLCIIALSVLVYLTTYPMTMKSMLAMKKMQALNPKIAELREKYKSNPQKLNKETMALYKTHKVNPMGGCLPMFFQMTIFLGLLQVLWRAVDLKGATFLWIKDLSAPDRLFVFSNKLPLIGNEFNILPFFMIIIMFFQQKLSSKNMVVTDEAQKKQQQMMTILFPILFGFIFYKFASGLTLYFSMYYIFSTLSQWKMSKK